MHNIRATISNASSIENLKKTQSEYYDTNSDPLISPSRSWDNHKK